LFSMRIFVAPRDGNV
jgi:uncharacterized protein (DUF433 family)/predicted nuclease of predicted toxin-antitoxin system